jgi:hypothetical protein
MVLLNVEFQDFDEIFLVAKKVDTLPCILGKIMLEYPETVLGAKDNVVFAFIYGV